jgi:Zn-dependent protease
MANDMIKPEVVPPGEKLTQIGNIFDSPLVVKGSTWFPMTEIIVLGIMIHEAGRLHPERSWLTRLGVATLTMPVILGSEWSHNLAHAAVAKMVGHPADAIRITWGMPLLVYYDIEDTEVTPRAHILRALGGPIINITFLGIAALLLPWTKPKSISRDIVNAALGMNAFLIFGGLLPIPGIDGGAILKWALVEKGQSPTQADETIRKVDMITAMGLSAGAVVSFKRHKRLLGGIFAVFAGLALAVGTGLFREKGQSDKPIFQRRNGV